MSLKRGWLKGMLEAARKEVKSWPAWMRGRRLRAYSVAGWARDKHGVYRNGESRILQRGRAWIRQDLAIRLGAGKVAVDEIYPTLRAAIKQEKPPAPPLLSNFCYCLQPTDQKEGFCIQCGLPSSPTAVETRGERR